MSGKKQILPSHMKKAIARLEQLSGVVNLVIEAVDARAPRSTRCEFIARVIGGCDVATVLTKADLADPSATKAWLNYFSEQGLAAVLAPGKSHRDRDAFLRELLKSAGASPPPSGTRAVVVGLPNVGKSTITNFIIGKRSARVGAMPGVTRGLQLINVRDDFLLLDTPGIVSPRVAMREEGLILALAGCLQENLYEPDEAAFFLLKTALPHYSEVFGKYYDLKDIPDDPLEFCEAVAVRRGFLKKGGVPDTELAIKHIVHEFATGRIAGITLEFPDSPKEREQKSSAAHHTPIK